MATNPVVSLPNADAVREALRGLRVRRSSPRRCAPATPSMPAASACRRSPGRRRTARSPTPSAASRASGRSCRRPARRGRIGGSSPRSRERLGFGEAFAWQSAADIFREHAALSAFENDGTRDFDIGAYADHRRSRLRDAGALRLAGAGRRQDERRPLLRRRRLLPSRPARALRGDRAACAGARHRPASGRCGSTPAACATSGTP